jgi:(2R)-3-sulfolactate dehydrogenase (NADP+)
MPLISATEGRALAESVLMKSHVSETNAAIVADALIAAELDSLGSHGLARLLAYADQAIAGKVNGFATPAISFPTTAIVHVDAKDGFAFPAIRTGIESIPARIKEAGIIALAVARSHHSGVAGHHVERLAECGLVAMFFSNSPAAIAPWGGHVPTYGTNPIAFATPTGGAPLVVDLGLSKVARGKIMVASQRGEPIPDDWAFDGDGYPTTDAKAALAGALAPIGGPKGAALALMVEILAATMTGSNHAFEASSFFDDKGGPPRVGQLILAFDPQRFSSDFPQRLETLLRHVTGQEGVRLPGARRLALREKHRAEGFPIDDGLLEKIRARLA